MLAEELKIPVVLFDTPYNRLAVPNNVVRVYNWQEANQFITQFSNSIKSCRQGWMKISPCLQLFNLILKFS